MVQLLLERYRVDPDSKNTDNRTPLSHAIENGYTVLVRLLITQNSVDLNFKNKKDRIPLFWAVKNEQNEAVKLLLRERIDIHAINFFKQTALYKIILIKRKMAILLLENKFDITVKNKNGSITLHLAVL